MAQWSCEAPDLSGPKKRFGAVKLFPDTLKQLKECVRYNEYVATLHAEEEMDEDELSIFDIERAILTGEIVERQKDEEKPEWKYLVRGQTVDEGQVIVVAKISPTGKGFGIY